jgi:CubicO group peptidase (beta-lactamase class C family)
MRGKIDRDGAKSETDRGLNRRNVLLGGTSVAAAALGSGAPVFTQSLAAQPYVDWYGKSLAEHEALTKQYQSQNYGFISLSVYGATSSPHYAAVMAIPAPAPQHQYPAVPAHEWQKTFNAEAAQGYGPVIIAATGPASNPVYAAVFEPQNPIPLTRNALGQGSANDTSTIQGMNAQAKSQGLILRWAASYGDNSGVAFAAIWTANNGQTMWNADGVLDSAPAYQARFSAETSGWCRPALVTPNSLGQYLSLFVDDQLIGGWEAHHDLTPAQYGAQLNTAKKAGYFPLCVQAGGSDPNTAVFAAIFAKSPHVVAKPFIATGPVANAQIDAVIEQYMASYTVRHAALAIVHGTQLVYARGYTMAEVNWPQVQPTTCFRLASVSKFPTAIAIFQLVQEGKLNIESTVQSILELRTPSGGPPPDPKFNQITVQQLLEHTSGLQDECGDSMGIYNAYEKAGISSHLPVTAEMTDSYLASLWLANAPGSVQNYNNTGYYFLGRIVAKLRNEKRPIDAYQKYLFDPLSITRIRRAASLLSDQPADEARYQEHDLNVYSSVMTDAQPLVPDTYGNVEWEIQEGCGGLSAAATDIARLIAIMISQKENPAISRLTLVLMLLAAAKLNASGLAGYGFDHVLDLGGGQFYGQKGGLIGSSSTVAQFNGDWGYTMLWANNGPAVVTNYPNLEYYPDFPAIMHDIVPTVNWGSADLFPQFGMPSL